MGQLLLVPSSGWASSTAPWDLTVQQLCSLGCAIECDTISGTTREFRGVQSGEAHIHALEKAVKSGERSLESSKKGFLAGSSTNVDILNAQEQIYTARRDLFEAKLRYLMAKLRLAANVGALGHLAQSLPAAVPR